MVSRLALIGLLALGPLLPVPASAGSILFDFNSLAANVNSALGNLPGQDPIEDYMEAIYGSAITVARGAKTLKERPEAPHPAGLYLGNSDGALARGPFTIPPGHADPKDTYLINRWDSSCCLPTERDRITIIFEAVPILAAEFDWEIFPVNSAATTADFTFKADGVVYFFTELLTLTEKQLGSLGHVSVVFPRSVRMLEFIDWTDAPIGIDNLRVVVPLPASLLLLGAGLLAAALLRRRTAPGW